MNLNRRELLASIAAAVLHKAPVPVSVVEQAAACDSVINAITFQMLQDAYDTACFGEDRPDIFFADTPVTEFLEHEMRCPQVRVGNYISCACRNWRRMYRMPLKFDPARLPA